MSFLDKNGLTYFYSKIKEKFIRSVNSQTPDSNGNVLISNVATADNLTSPDAKPHNSKGFIYRTSGGTEDLASGEAELIYIDGASEHTGYIPESHTPSSTNGIQIEINKNDWPFKESGEYTFIYYPPTGSQAVPSWTPASVSWEFNGQPVDNISTSYGINVLNLVMPRIVITNDNNNLTITVVPDTWINKGLESSTYYLSYQEAGWSLNDEQIILNDYGINIVGTPTVGNTIIIEYVQGTLYGSLTITYQIEVLGTIEVAKPTQFVATGFNQFDKDSMVIENATIQDNQIVENSGTYLCYCREPGNIENGFVAYSKGGHIESIGWCEDSPEIGMNVITDNVTYDNLLSVIEFENDGYIVVVVDTPDDLCIHPQHSKGYNNIYEEYTAPSIITFPTQDVEGNPLPLADYGMPAVHGTADRLNLDLGTYIQRIGRITNNPEGWNFIINNKLRDQEEHDSGYIYYILPTPVVYQVTANPLYIISDMGTEEFIGATIPIPCQLLYGQNLRDKLRNDVLTISSQDLTDNQKNSVWNNIGIDTIIEKVLTLTSHDVLSYPDTEISANDDLNNYWHPGVRVITTGAIAATIKNVPPKISGGAKLITIAQTTSTGSYSAQLYFQNGGSVWYRQKQGSSTTPSKWKNIIYTELGEKQAVNVDSNFKPGNFLLEVYPYSNFAMIYYNIQLPVLTTDTEVTMCNISNSLWAPLQKKINFTIAGQKGSNFLLQIYQDGKVTIYTDEPMTKGAEYIRGTVLLPTQY